MNRYNPKEIEPKWQTRWADGKVYEVTEEPGRSKRYVTAMFPYPSGAGLHVGHVRNYSITDAIARFQRQNGQNTLTTIGWDGFGLPAENYAIKTGVAPAVSTTQNIQNFKGQLQRLGMSYDWSRELNTTDPSYYKWTQYLFLQLFKQGLAYQKESLQWWCPHDKTVLANEQVEGGRCWRCGHEVIKKSMKQWFFKITDYADDLLDGIEDLDWPDKIKTMQRNWIGKSKGAEIRFKMYDSRADSRSETDENKIPDQVRNDGITVFTTRPDTLYGVTFLVMAPEHPLLEQLTTPERKAAVLKYRDEAIKQSEIQRQESKEKTGEFTGAYAINPSNGEKLPIWTADYVLMGYGTGAIMAVPAHDERDYSFAKQFDLPITQVVMPIADDTTNPPRDGLQDVRRDTVIVHLKDKSTGKYALLNWHESLEGITTAIMGGIEADQTAEEAAKMEIREEAGLEGITVTKQLTWITGARYCASHKNQNRTAVTTVLLAEVDSLDGQKPVDEKEQKQHTLIWVDETQVLNRLTPDHQKFVWQQLHEETAISGEGEMLNSGLYDGLSTSEAREKIVADLEKQGVAIEKTNYKMRDWLISRQRYWGAPIPIIHCPKDGAVAVPEDQLPVVLPEVDNYEPDGSGKGVLGRATDWVQVTCPTCGGPAERETDTMDGYVCSSWYLFRYTDASNDAAPWDPAKANYWAPLDFYCGGDHAVAHLLYVRFWTRVFKKLGLVDFAEPIKRLVYNGYIYAHDGTKMSKSKGNVVDPLEVIESGYGADSLRTYELFCGPYEQDTSWDPGGVAGTFRFLSRVWTLVQEYDATDGGTADSPELLRAVHRAIKKVSSDLEQLSFNTAIAALMECVNDLYRLKAVDNYTSAEWQWALESLVQLVAPFAPHMASELWQQLGNDDSVHVNHWPTYDEAYLVEDTVTIAVQVNGKLRGTVSAPAGSDEATAVELAKADEKIAANLDGKEVVKTIYVPGKLVNFVVR